MRETSKWGIFLPPPKLGLSKHLETPEAIIAHVRSHPATEALMYVNRNYSEFHPNPTPEHPCWSHLRLVVKDWKRDLLDLNRSWRIERSRADHLEEMVESLQREVADLRGKNGWFRRIFPRRAMKKLTGAQMDMLNGL